MENLLECDVESWDVTMPFPRLHEVFDPDRDIPIPYRRTFLDKQQFLKEKKSRYRVVFEPLSQSLRFEATEARAKEVPAAVERKFSALAEEWRNATMLSSSSTDRLSHPAYLKIIGMGPAAIPLILRELEQHGGHWFLALRSITDADPVQPEDAGKIKTMAEAWIRWGKQNGYL
jgi:hypothetical protein